jgi:hypothetical protein
MSQVTGIALAVGAVTFANEALFAPILGESVAVNWKILPATVGLALALTGLERIAPDFAVGLAWMALFTAVAVRYGNAPTPLENLNKIFGYSK